MFLRIPEQYRPGIKKITSVSDDAIQVIDSLLSNQPPSFRIISKLVQASIKTGKIEEIDAVSIIDTIVNLYKLKEEENLSGEEVAISLVGYIRNNKDEFPSFSQDDEHRFVRRLTSLLKFNPSLEITSKAFSLIREYERIYSEAKITTDIRPVFDSDTENNIDAFLVVHTMRIGYLDADGSKEFYVALDSDDLEKLQENIFIALENKSAIELLLKKTGVPYLDNSYRDDQEE